MQLGDHGKLLEQGTEVEVEVVQPRPKRAARQVAIRSTLVPSMNCVVRRICFFTIEKCGASDRAYCVVVVVVVVVEDAVFKSASKRAYVLSNVLLVLSSLNIFRNLCAEIRTTELNWCG